MSEIGRTNKKHPETTTQIVPLYNISIRNDGSMIVVVE
jgi:hypothetical protein